VTILIVTVVLIGVIVLAFWRSGQREEVDRANRRRELREAREKAVRKREVRAVRGVER